MKFNLDTDSINYIKIVFKDCQDNTCCKKAAIKCMNEREIYACAKIENGLSLQTPQNVSISFVCENGLYRTNSVLKYIENKDDYVYFALRTPEGIEYQQNREYFRVKMNENAIISFENNVIPCKVHDISANGARPPPPPPNNMPEEVTVDILFQPKSIKTRAQFVRYDEDDGILKASFHFKHLPESDMDVISKKCIQKQLEYKRTLLNGMGGGK